MSDTQQTEKEAAEGAGSAPRRYRVNGVCLVPTFVEMEVTAMSEEEAVRIALSSEWRSHIANGYDDGAAYDWEPTADEVDEPSDGPPLCSNCVYGGRAAKGCIRCVHPHWDEIGEPPTSHHRDMLPSDAHGCVEYERNVRATNKK